MALGTEISGIWILGHLDGKLHLLLPVNFPFSSRKYMDRLWEKRSRSKGLENHWLAGPPPADQLNTSWLSRLGCHLTGILLPTCAETLGPLSSGLHMPLIGLENNLVPTSQHFAALCMQVSNEKYIQLFPVPVDVLRHMADEENAVAEQVVD